MLIGDCKILIASFYITKTYFIQDFYISELILFIVRVAEASSHQSE